MTILDGMYGKFVTFKDTLGRTRQGAIVDTKNGLIREVSGTFYYCDTDSRITIISNPPPKCKHCGLPLGNPCTVCKEKEDNVSRMERLARKRKKETQMKIFHVVDMEIPNSKGGTSVYQEHRQFWGHIVTSKFTRTHDRFAHLFSSDGTRVHHLNYPTFKELASNFEHVYIEPKLTRAEYEEIRTKLKKASHQQLLTLQVHMDNLMMDHKIKKMKGE